MSSSPVKVYSEFQPLEEMIVGRCYAPEAFNYLDDHELRDMLQRIMSETEEDCTALVRVLQQNGVTVRRPDVIFDLTTKKKDGSEVYAKVDTLQFNYTYPNPPLWPRDLNFVMGNQVMSLFARTGNRYFESWSLYNIFLDYFKAGAKWISMPLPILNNTSKDYSEFEQRQILFHAANMVKYGRDIFHSCTAFENKNARGTGLGLEWVKTHLAGEYRFHMIPRPGHLDGKISIIRPGLVVSNISKNELPPIFNNWDVILVTEKQQLPQKFLELRGRRYYKEFVKNWLTEWIGCADETYFDVNLISLDEKTVLTNGYSAHLFSELEKRGVNCIPIDFRHRFFWDGGLHCITLDIRRRGECEDYFS